VAEHVLGEHGRYLAGVGRRGNDEIDLSMLVGEQARCESCVAFDDVRGVAGALGVSMLDVCACEFRPAGRQLYTDGPPACVDCLHECRADPAHGIKDQLAGLAVCLDRLARERGQHLGGVAV
jgi:hypothetical protein